MVMFSKGQRSDDLGLMLDGLIVSEEWGEIWRAAHDEYGRVLIVGYKRAEGRKIFNDSLRALKKWKEMAEFGSPGFVKVFAIHAKAKVPIVLLQDPGGKTAREFFMTETRRVKNAARMAQSCSRVIQQACERELTPIWLSPDTIIHHPLDKATPWWVVPVTPALLDPRFHLGEGRYDAPRIVDAPKKSGSAGDTGSDVWKHVSEEDRVDLKPHERNYDMYALSKIWIEALGGNFSIQHSIAKMDEHVPYPRLRVMIENGLRAQDGKYFDPSVADLGIERWLKHGADEDRRDYEEKLAEEEAAAAKAGKQGRKHVKAEARAGGGDGERKSRWWRR